jgi:hypothetical protein
MDCGRIQLKLDFGRTKFRLTRVQFYQRKVCSKMRFYQIPFYQSLVLPRFRFSETCSTKVSLYQTPFYQSPVCQKTVILPNFVLPKSTLPFQAATREKETNFVYNNAPPPPPSSLSGPLSISFFFRADSFSPFATAVKEKQSVRGNGTW